MSKRKKKRNSNNANAENNNLKLVSKEENEEMNAIGAFEKMGKKIDGFRKSKAGKATGIVAIIGAIGIGIWQVITHFFKDDDVSDDYDDDIEDTEFEEVDLSEEDEDSSDASED